MCLMKEQNEEENVTISTYPYSRFPHRFYYIGLLILQQPALCCVVTTFTTLQYVLTLFLLGGGSICPPCSFFLNNSKSIGLRLLKFSDFSYIPKALPLGLKPGFNTKCLSPQAHCLNDCFFLYQTKSLF